MKPEQLEIERLRRGVTKLKAERDILIKAAAYFARDVNSALAMKSIILSANIVHETNAESRSISAVRHSGDAPIDTQTRAVSDTRLFLATGCSSGSRRARIIKTMRSDGNRAAHLVGSTGHNAQQRLLPSGDRLLTERPAFAQRRLWLVLHLFQQYPFFNAVCVGQHDVLAFCNTEKS